MAQATDPPAAAPLPRLEVIEGPLGGGARVMVPELVARAAWADGAKPLSDAALLSRAPEDVHILAWGRSHSWGEVATAAPSAAPPVLVGYAHVDCASGTGELVVDPAHRGQGLGARLAAAATAAGARSFWAHGDFPPARALAARLGLVPVRRLMLLARPLAAADAAGVRWPAGYHLRGYRPGLDDEGLLQVNAAAFADLPDQGGWTSADLEERKRAEWFAPADVLLLCADARPGDPGVSAGAHPRVSAGADPGVSVCADPGVSACADPGVARDARPGDPGALPGGEIVGFHWTKRHSAEVGEVYVVGLDPAHQGRGLGRPLVAAGLARLAGTGCQEAVLFVDATNPGAVHLYRSMGFVHQRDDVLYGLAGGAGGLAG